MGLPWKRKPKPPPDVTYVGLYATFTSCCGWVPNRQEIGAPLYVFTADQHLGYIDNPVTHQEDQ